MSAEPDGTSMVDRIFGILDAFRSGDLSLSASDIARRSRLPMATAHRIVGDLVSRGVLERDADRRIHIGMRMWEIATTTPVLRLRDVAVPFMVDLHEAVGQVVQLTTLDRDEVLSLERIASRRTTSLNIAQPGTRLPVLACAPGIVALAFSAPETRERLLAESPLVAFTGETVIDRYELRDAVRRAGSRGHFVAEGWMSPQITGMAAPILGPDGFVGALSITFRRAEDTSARILPALRATAEGIAAALSGSSPLGAPQVVALRQRIRRAMRPDGPAVTA